MVTLRRPRRGEDQGVSPVIAVILMVAITVVLAATVYVWVSQFGTQTHAPEHASVTARAMDADGNGTTEWIRLTLVRGQSAPYGVNATLVDVVDPTGATVSELCTSPQIAGTSCAQAYAGSDTWHPGGTLYVPCSGHGGHTITVTLRQSVVHDSTVRCDASP